MKISIKHNGITFQKEIPISWKEVPFGKFLKLGECGDDYIKVFALFTEIDEAILRKADIENMYTVIQLLSFLSEPCTPVVPEEILGWKIPKDLGMTKLGQWMDLKDDIKKTANDPEMSRLARYPMYCAIYACEQRYGEYDWEKAEWMAPAFLNAPSPEVLGIGNFTLKKLIELSYGINNSALRPLTPAKKYRQVFKNLPQILGITQLFSTWRKRLRLPESNS